MPSQESPSSGGLDRALNGLGTLMIVLSAVTPASSVFIIVPGVIALAGTGSFLSFLFAAIIGLFMAFVYAELSSAYPTAGGEYTMIGRTLGRFWGFVTLVLVFISIVLIIAVVALGVGTYLGVLLPNLNAQWVGVATIILAGIVAALRIKLNAFVTGIFLGIEMLALLILVALGFINIERPLSSLFTSPQILDAATNSLVPASTGLIWPPPPSPSSPTMATVQRLTSARKHRMPSAALARLSCGRSSSRSPRN